MSKFSALSVGLALLDAFEKIHEAGYTFNDLKPDNILMGFNPDLDENLKRNVFKNTKIHLVDFGMAESYIVDGEHISQNEIQIFRGNMIFASLD